MLVGELERLLLADFPVGQAEAWDRTGMLVGDPHAEVRAVAVALDPTVSALSFARESEANVLVTHHPLFLDPPTSVLPPACTVDVVAGRIWEAVSAGISVLSFHTALDASPLAARVLADPLGLVPDGGLLEDAGAGVGYGRLCAAGGLTLDGLASRCRDAFRRPVRIWGDGEAALDRICLWTGAAGDAPRKCLEQGVDALVCGEVKYHAALDASEQGLVIVELGHDVSEQVHCGVLVESLVRAGVTPGNVHLMEPPVNWR